MVETGTAPLAGLTVVVTRPAGVGEATATSLVQAGADVIALPLLALIPREPGVDALRLKAANDAVFVSANAVEFGLPILRAAGFPRNATCYAVGEATAAVLRENGQSNVVSPQQQFDSEGLLALPALNAVEGASIILVKGVGRTTGRPLIEETLRQRGADVIPVVCYERRDAAPDAVALSALASRLASGAPVVVQVASVESFEALRAACGERGGALKRAWLAVPHPRVEKAVQDAGCPRTLVAPLSAAGLVAALKTASKAWRSNHE